MFKHVVITRFNIYDPSFSNKIWSTERANYRLSIFENITCSSIASQTNKNFSWYVISNQKSSRLVLDHLQKLSNIYNFEVILCSGGISYMMAGSCYNHEVFYENPYLITTRVDADDALAIDHVERVQGEFREQELDFINFEFGIRKKLGSKESTVIVYKENPFQSLIERVSPPIPVRTVYCAQHQLTHTIAPVHNISNIARPAWLQVIHDDNIGNSLGNTKYWNNPDLQTFFKVKT